MSACGFKQFDQWLNQPVTARDRRQEERFQLLKRGQIPQTAAQLADREEDEWLARQRRLAREA